MPCFGSYLHQRHVRAQRQQHLLRLGGVGVVPVLVEPVLQRPGHVLQNLTLVTNFDPAETRPGGIRTYLLCSSCSIICFFLSNHRVWVDSELFYSSLGVILGQWF